MTDNKKLEWELIQHDTKGEILEMTDRLSVPGGWLVRSSITISVTGIITTSANTSLSMTFIPDQNHKWKLHEK